MVLLPLITVGIGVATLRYLLPRLGYREIDLGRALGVTGLGLILGGFIGGWVNDLVIAYMFLSSWPELPREIAAYLCTLGILAAWSHFIYNRFLHTHPRDGFIIVATQAALITAAFLALKAVFALLAGLDG